MKIILIIFFSLVLVSTTSYFLISEMKPKRMEIMAELPIDYNLFKVELLKNTRYMSDDLIGFDLPETLEFKILLSNPSMYQENIKRFIVDNTVPIKMKVGYAASMISLDVFDLANFVDYLNTLSLDQSELYSVVNAVAFNIYKSASFVNPDLVSHQVLADHASKKYVWQVFKNIYDNPLTSEKDRNNKNGGLYNIVINRKYK